MADPLVTIGIPTHNRSGMLRQALESALAQTYPNVEVIVSDNGSTDNTPQVLSASNSARLSLYRHEPPIHPMDNWNLCWERASGEYFVMLHDDDYLEAEFCERLVDLYTKHPEIILAMSGVCLHRGDRIELSKPSPEVREGYNLIRDFFDWRRTVHLCCLMFRTDLLRSTGGFSREYKFSQDCSVWMPLCMRGKIACDDAHLSHYRLHNGSGTHAISMLPRLEDHVTLAGMCITLARKRGLNRHVIGMLESAARRNIGRTAARYALEQAEAGMGRRELSRELRRWHGYMLTDWADAVPRMLLAYALPPASLSRLRTAHEKRKSGGTVGL